MRKIEVTIATVAILLVLNLVGAQLSWAATYWAAPNGSDSNSCSSVSGSSDPGRYRTFSGTVSCATVNGDIVMVKPGTYTSNATILNPASGVTIRGSDSTSANWPILRPTGSSVRGVNFNNTTRSGIMFKYLRWDMSNVTSAANCISLSSDASVSFTMEDFECLGPPAGKADTTASGIKISQGSRAIIRRGIISRWHSAESSPGAHGLYWNGSNGLVEDTKIFNINGWCLQWYWSGGSINNNVFRNNICSDATNKGGVYIQTNATGNQVYDDRFCNLNVAIRNYGSGTQISNNTTSATSCASSTSTSSTTTTTPSAPSTLQAVAQ